MPRPAPSSWLLRAAALVLACACACPVAALDPDKAFHHYVRNTWSIEQGLPQISALAIAQDRPGYLWVGTQAGLARFDGIRFVPFTPENTPGLRGIWIHDLLVDADNRLWIATYRGVSVRDENGFRALPLAGSEPDRQLDTQDLEATASGELMVAAPDGVHRIVDDRLELAWPLPRPATVLMTRGDELWVGSRGRVYRIAGGDVEALALPEGDDDTVVTQLVEAQGRLWAGTSAGLFWRDGDRWTRHEDGAPLSTSPIEAMHADRDGNLWVGLVEDLLRLQDGRLRETIRDSGGGSTGTAVRSIFEDREGNLWLGGQWAGLTRLWNGWTRRYGELEGLSDPILWSVARDAEGRVWAGTMNGLDVMEDGRFRRVVDGADLPHPNAYTLLPEGDLIWIGTRRGVATWDGTTLRAPPELAPLRSAQINGIHRDVRGALWFATNQGLFRLVDGQLFQFGAAAGLRDPRTRLLFETSDGRLLLGTQSGLYEIAGDRLVALGLDTGLPPDLDVTAIHELADGRLVIGVISEQVFIHDGGRWTGFGEEQGLPANSAFFIGDDRGYLWVAGIRGIYRAPIAGLDAVAAGRAERVGAEMVLNERGDRRGGQKGYCCNGAGNAKGFLHDGQLWLPTREGLVAMATGGIVRNPVAPRTLIERVRVGDQWRDADPAAGWNLGQDDRDLSFEFTVLSFQDPGSNDLRYRLVGYDRDWRTLEAMDRRVVNYTNLPPGRYVFEAIGANNADVWSTAPAQLGFAIAPRFHETPLFFVLLAALLASIVYAGYRQQQASHRRQREALENLVRQRTEALEVANHRLEDASQTDPLTGLRNRRYLAGQIPADIAYYSREALRLGARDGAMVFGLLDIDHFKAVNDQHGHGAGDRVLQQLAQLLQQKVRVGDYVARWGGEEFLLVFRPLPPEHLTVLGERICSAVAEHRFDIGGADPLRLTCSVGFVECPLLRDARGALGWEQMVEVADRALYVVKRNGRDGWAAFRAPPGADPEVLALALAGDIETLVRSGRLQLVGSRATPR
jgi:diguanylate cyclase (GGDEF)-like protein